MDWLNIIKANWSEIIVIALALIEVAKRIVKMTETKKDDEAVEKLGLWLKMIVMLSGHTVKPKEDK